MRSLTPTILRVSFLDKISSGSKAGNIAIDPENGVIYVALEKEMEGGGVEVSIVRVDSAEDRDSSPEVIATFDSPVRAPFPLPSHMSEILDLHYLSDDRSLVVLLAGGDIATLSLEGLDGGAAPLEVVGSVDSGIKAAAWSPDEEQLVLITGEDNLVVMTRLFDIVHEEPLRKDDFGEDDFINVGWGSKSTQFHGSLGKAAAQSSSSSTQTDIPTSLSHPTDDGLPRITFRGDAAFFAISSLDPYTSSPTHARRQVRIYSRDASAGFIPRLSATSESLPGLEPALSWRPSGNLISSVVRYGYSGGGEGKEGKWDIAMLERNGLRHGGFPLREKKDVWAEGKVRGMSWNSDSEVLAIWVERRDEDVVQLWSMKNYHYYLKQEVFPMQAGSQRFMGFKWHPEQPLTLYLLGQDYVATRSFVWDTYVARLPMPNDTATVAVVDGDRLLVTPFRTQNTPPPMSSYTISLPSTPVHVACSSTEDALAAVLSNGEIQVYDLNTRLPDAQSGSKLRGGGKIAEPKLRWEEKVKIPGSWCAKQVVMGPHDHVGVLLWAENDGNGECRVAIARPDAEITLYPVESTSERLLWSDDAGWVVIDGSGSLQTVEGSTDKPSLQMAFCPSPLSIAISPEPSLIFALSLTGKLHFTALNQNANPVNLASSVTSFTLTPDFLIYTTSSQNSYYAPLSILGRMANGEDLSSHETEWETRRVERGALAVIACPSSMSLVLQMPRGNLETVYPRALVLTVVRRDVMAGAYRSALVTCRKHRLDLNILYDLDPKRFMDSLPQFLEQIPEVDYLNLFVSALVSSDSSNVLYHDLRRKVSPTKTSVDKVNNVCDAIRRLLEPQLVRYIDTILTTHVCKQPSDYEAGLRVLLTLQGADHKDVVEDAIKYIIFLSDVNKLYDVALGMYNFQLVLMVAQYSQKDPKEYLPFLRELRALDKWEQRFRIDDHLGRRASALRNLQQAGPDRFGEAASYLSRYELYDEAFKIYAGDEERLPGIYDLYGDYLYDRRDFHESAIAYGLAKQPTKAMKAYERAHTWRELFALALQQKTPREKILELCERVTDHLSSRGKSLEAAQVYLDYAQDVDSAVEVLCKSTEFAEAYRIIALHDRVDLVEDVIHPGLDDVQESLSETFEEMRGQLDKEMNRLKELRMIRNDDADTFYIVDNEPELEGIDVATNATTVATAFTRYTVAPTTAFSQSTKITGRTDKSKHKASKKRQAGRKGTVDEYEYLLSSIGRLVIRVDEKSAEVMTLLRHLVLATANHRDSAISLQAEIIRFREDMKSAIEEAWRDRQEILEGVVESGGMGLNGGEDVEKAKGMVRPVVDVWKGVGVLTR